MTVHQKFIILLAIPCLALLAACGGDDDDGSADEAASADADAGDGDSTSGDGDVSLVSAEQAALDEALTDYVASNFPEAPAYVGDCETITRATCGQFRGIDADRNEYFIIGDPASFESVAWIVATKDDAGEWDIVAHDVSNGWSRGDTALVVPGDCQEVRAIPGTSGEVVECLEALSSVTVVGGPRLAEGVLFFPIGDERWILGLGICDPERDDNCVATS
ncbi:MAG: hypothetical protein WEB00_00270 [Dehalococcoidia bacterium]